MSFQFHLWPRLRALFRVVLSSKLGKNGFILERVLDRQPLGREGVPALNFWVGSGGTSLDGLFNFFLGVVWTIDLGIFHGLFLTVKRNKIELG